MVSITQYKLEYWWWLLHGLINRLIHNSLAKCIPHRLAYTYCNGPKPFPDPWIHDPCFRPIKNNSDPKQTYFNFTACSVGPSQTVDRTYSAQLARARSSPTYLHHLKLLSFLPFHFSADIYTFLSFFFPIPPLILLKSTSNLHWISLHVQDSPLEPVQLINLSFGQL